MTSLKYLQAIDFEISLGCPLIGLHKGVCPISDPRRWDKLSRARPMTDTDIVQAVEIAYRFLDFRGWILWHYFNEPLLGLNRLEGLIPRLKEQVPEARTGLWTSGEVLPDDLARLEIFDQVVLKNYTGRDLTAVLAAHPNIKSDSEPIMDARMTTLPRLNNQRRCRRMWDELIVDYYGHGHICTGDWTGEVDIGNIKDGFEPLASRYIAVREQISQQPMGPTTPLFCQNCALTMREGNCIIDEQLFKEITTHRGF